MDDRGIAARLHDLPAVPRRAVVALFLGLTALFSWWGVVTVAPDLPIAFWWPAAATAGVGALISRGRRIFVALVVATITTVVHVAFGRSFELSLVYGLGTGLEVWVFVQLLTRGRAHARMHNLKQMGWFLICSAVAAGVLAVILAAGAWLLAGADPVLTALSAFTSHSSAFFALVPLALVSLTAPLRQPLWEPIVQTLALAVLTVVVFGPAATLAATFLIITTLMWGAYRLPPVFPAVQTMGIAVIATVATAMQIGPFSMSGVDDPRAAVFALQLFIMTHAAAGLFVSAQSAEWNASLAELAAREHDASLVADELLQLNTQKDDFISAVSHELRTPVTSILGFSEQLVDTNPDPETEQAGRIIYRNARRLADVIEDVLELSRLSTTQGSNRPPADVEVQGLLHACIDDTVGLVPTDRRLTVDLVAPQHPVIIRAVEPDLFRVMSNLLTNALKFSPPEGTVTVTLTEPDAAAIEVSITDEGPGIPLAEQEAVWERFYRVQSPQHRDVPGTGLGLPIVRSLVEHRVGGEVTLRSNGHKGTTVWVRVPRAPTPVVSASQSADE